MHTLTSWIPYAKQPNTIRELSDGDALKLLEAFASTYSESDPRIDEQSRLQFYVLPKRYMLQTQSALGIHKAGFHSFEAKANASTIAALGVQTGPGLSPSGAK